MQYQLQSCSNRELEETSNCTQPISYASKSKCTHAKSAISLALLLTLPVVFAGNSIAADHQIQMTAEETSLDDGLGNRMLAYKILSHRINNKPVNVNKRYGGKATIPGPTIVITEGDTVTIDFSNDIPDTDIAPTEQGQTSNQVSIHVHGVHYDIESDGTLEIINQVTDEGAGYGPGGHIHPAGNVPEYSYTWTAAPGTAGTWAYHDHNFMTHNGAEQRGLFGALIVNPAGTSFDQEYVLYMTDDAFWGMEIDANGDQTKHGVNPDLTAKNGDNVRFHLISLGTDIQTFTLDGYQWDDPGTTNLINQVAIGPLEKHVFAVTATHNAEYRDKNFTNNLMGVRGLFNVQ